VVVSRELEDFRGCRGGWKGGEGYSAEGGESGEEDGRDERGEREGVGVGCVWGEVEVEG